MPVWFMIPDKVGNVCPFEGYGESSESSSSIGRMMPFISIGPYMGVIKASYHTRHLPLPLLEGQWAVVLGENAGKDLDLLRDRCGVVLPV